MCQAERMTHIVIDRLNLIQDNASAGTYTSDEAFALALVTFAGAFFYVCC